MGIENFIVTGLFWTMASIVFALVPSIKKREKPINFWAGIEVKSEEIADISAYNAANAKMWFVVAVITTCLGAIGLFSPSL